MVVGNLRPLMLAALLFVFARSVYATSCFEPTVEQAIAFSREAQQNSFVKGFILGLILVALAANLGWFILRTRRWIIGVFLLLLAVTVGLVYSAAEVISSGCDFGSMTAHYYLYPFGFLVVSLLFQLYWTRRSRGIISITLEQ